MMLFWLVILGAWMGWVSPADKHVDIDGHPVEHDWYCLFPEEIPEMFLRPELIPVKSDGLPAVAEAERVVRSRR